MGLLIPIAGVGAIAGINMLQSRLKVYERFYGWGQTLRKLGLAYDIPVIGGDAESKVKEKLFSTFSDAARGLARGLADKPMQESE